jgi:hypothetical protein
MQAGIRGAKPDKAGSHAVRLVGKPPEKSTATSPELLAPSRVGPFNLKPYQSLAKSCAHATVRRSRGARKTPVPAGRPRYIPGIQIRVEKNEP